ncbi:MAG: ParA family protein [Candidatus Krumholzibacteria bacterium]|nr:ParA family protein [Candidatus Krumholzibacteria bacterium]
MSDIDNSGKNSPTSNITHPDFHPRRRTPWGTVDGRVISFVSRKGGVGKTTSAVNLGAALALSGHTVLIVGTDPQCGVCRTLGVQPHELTTCLSGIFTDNQPLTDMVHPSALQDLFFISPRILTLEEEESYLQAMEGGPDTFIREIDRARHLYDTILIDCPPGLSASSKTALMASDSYLVPLQAEELCRDSVDSLLEFVDTFRERIYPSHALAPKPFSGTFTDSETDRPLALEGIFLTMASTRTRMGRHVATRASEDFGDVLFETSVPRTTRLSEMALRGKPAVIYDRRSAGSRAYFNLADELVQRYGLTENSMGLKPGSTIPDSSTIPDQVDLRSPSSNDEMDESEGTPDRKMPAAGGLDRFLADMGGPEETASSIPSFEEPIVPEIVSLDELLAEEENQNKHEKTDEDWDEGYWDRKSDGGDRVN